MTNTEARKQRKSIAEDVQNGLPVAEAARKYARSLSYVYLACKEHDVKHQCLFPTTQQKVGKFTILKTILLNQHNSLAQIAKELNISKQRVGQIYREAKQINFPGLENLPEHNRGRRPHSTKKTTTKKTTTYKTKIQSRSK